MYWSHALTKQSVWEKPDELKVSYRSEAKLTIQTPFERAMNKTPWKQFTSKGKPYYVNSLTKETLVCSAMLASSSIQLTPQWDLPPELVELKNKIDEQERRKARGETS